VPSIHETIIRHLEARISSAFFSLTDPKINLIINQAIEHSLRLGPAGNLERYGNIITILKNTEQFGTLARLAAVAHRACVEEGGVTEASSLMMLGLWSYARNRDGHSKDVRLTAKNTWTTMKDLRRLAEVEGLILSEELATACFNLGLKKDVRSIHRMTLENCIETLGPKHPSTLWSACQFSNSLWSTGRLYGAGRLYQPVSGLT
jgi:hypothetical protein